MEVTPESLDLATFDHAVDDLVGILGLSFRAPVAAFDYFVIGKNALSLQVVDDPFVEVEAPVDKGVCHCGSRFAVSGMGVSYR